MAMPPILEETGQPQSTQFAHFGVLDNGAQSKTSTVTSVTINILLAVVIVIVGAATKKVNDKRIKLTELTEPIPIQKVEPIKPKVLPKPPPPLPDVPKIAVQPPKIVIPDIKPPDIPKPPVVKMDEPKPVIAPAPPKQVVAMAAPKVVDLSRPTAPAVVNNSAHPTAVALGSQTNPIAAATGPAKVDFGNKGAAGMPSSNTGAGRPTSVNIAGSGSPGGANNGTANHGVQGVKFGVPGGTGPMNAPGRVAGPVNLAVAAPPPMPKPAGAVLPPQRSAPKVLSKPKPEYTAEAIQLHLEGTVTVHIHVLPNGSVEVVGVTDSLGHGLDESAKRAAAATKFQPATDASGQPISWDGFVKVAFQLAG